MLLDARDRGSAVSGTLLAAVGALLLLDALYLIDVNLWDFWPLALVALGARVLMNVLADPDDAAVVSDAEESASAFLGAIERRNRSADFRGGSASAFMGGGKPRSPGGGHRRRPGRDPGLRDDGRPGDPGCRRNGRSRWG